MIKQGRVPGALGVLPGGGMPPGVLGIGPGIVFAQAVVGQAVKKFTMPPPNEPIEEGDSVDVNTAKWKPFPKGSPALGDVEQGGIGNCALASILAAHANTPDGRMLLVGMVKEHTGVAVETDVAGVGKLTNPPAGGKLTSNRYFTVTLDGKPFDVSDAFYTNDGEHDSWTMLYMRSPKDVLWPSVIEKAVAVRQGGYDKLDFNSLTANDMWKLVTGKAPNLISVDDKTPDADILKAARAAGSKPTITGSKKPAPRAHPHHGFVVLGVSGGKVELHDPARDEKTSFAPKEFRENFFFIMSTK